MEVAGGLLVLAMIAGLFLIIALIVAPLKLYSINRELQAIHRDTAYANQRAMALFELLKNGIERYDTYAREQASRLPPPAQPPALPPERNVGPL